MIDIQNFILDILSKAKIANIDAEDTDNQSSYKAEPILKTAGEVIAELPQKYREMRSLKQPNSNQYNYYAKLFYEQGKFMEDYEDDYEYKGEFERYFPTYQSMNDKQLRGYFSWRTKLRHGIIEKTSLSFAFIYIYELINNIGVESKLDGYNKLVNFLEAYKENESKIIHYLKIWIKDYVIYYGLDISLLNNGENNDSSCFEKLLNYKNCKPDEIASALIYFSNYNLNKSRFYKEYSEDFNEVIYDVFCRLEEYYSKNRINSLYVKMFGYISDSPYYIFDGAIFYKKGKMEDRVVFLNPCDKYIIKKGTWYHEYYPGLKKKNKVIGQILKTTDSIMREVYSFPYPVSLNKTVKIYNTIIEKAVADYCNKNGKLNFYLLAKQKKKKTQKSNTEENAVPAPVVIDTAKFTDIRNTAKLIQEKLIVDDEPVAQPLTVLNNSSSGMLNDIETKILKLLIENKTEKINNTVKESGVMLSVIIDAINEKLFEKINDNAIEFDGDTPVIVEDYLNELKGL